MVPAKKTQTNSADPDQTASSILISILLIPALITTILFEKKNSKVIELLENFNTVVMMCSALALWWSALLLFKRS